MTQAGTAAVRALVFPGQGSQAVGMGRELAESVAVARRVFAEVDDALGQDLSGLMADGPERELTLTENAQPALMAVSMAVLAVLREEHGIGVERLGRCVAGHSLGEYTALTAVGSFSIGDAARLLRIRGLAMQTAVPVGEGAMAALMGARARDRARSRRRSHPRQLRRRRLRRRQRQCTGAGGDQRQPRRGAARHRDRHAARRQALRHAAGQRSVPLPADGAGRRGDGRGAGRGRRRSRRRCR